MKSFRQYTEEMNPSDQENDGEDKNLKSKEKRQQQIKKMVLLKKMQAVRAGAGADIVAGYEPEGEMVDEGIGRAIKKGVRIAKRVVKDAGPYDPGGYTTIGSLGNPHSKNEDKRKKERAPKKVDESKGHKYDYSFI